MSVASKPRTESSAAKTAPLIAYFYDAEGHDREVELTPKALSSVGEKQLLWIDVERGDRDRLARIAKLLRLSAAAMAVIVDPPSPPVLSNFEGHFQLSLPLPPKSEGVRGQLPLPAQEEEADSAGKGDGGRVDFLVSKQWLLTVRDGAVDFFECFREQDKGESLKGRLSPAALAGSLLDWHLQTYHDAIAAIAEAIDKLDESILESREKRPPLSELAAMRRRVSKLRAAIDAHGQIIYGLLRADFAAIAESEDVEHYRALERRFERVEDSVEGVRNLVSASFDLYATRTAQDTNQLVQMLTLVTVIIGFCGAIAGIFGMNFETPFSRSGVGGFVEVTGAMIAVSAAVLALAKFRKWM